MPTISFKQSIIERIPEIYNFAKGNHELLGPDGYKIAITALLGFIPSNWEIEETFQDLEENGLPLQTFKTIIECKLKYIFLEQYICEMFSAFDPNFKGYITLEDLYKAWNKSESNLPWGKIEEAFKEVSKNGIVDYSAFQDIISEYSSADTRYFDTYESDNFLQQYSSYNYMQ